MTGDAFLIIPLPHRQSDGRWLRRQLLRVRNSYGKREHQRQNGYPDHDLRSRAIGPSNVGKFYLTFFADSERRNVCQHWHTVNLRKGVTNLPTLIVRSSQAAMTFALGQKRT